MPFAEANSLTEHGTCSKETKQHALAPVGRQGDLLELLIKDCLSREVRRYVAHKRCSCGLRKLHTTRTVHVSSRAEGRLMHVA